MRKFAVLVLFALPAGLWADPEVATVLVGLEGQDGGASGAVVKAVPGLSHVLTNKHVAPGPGRYFVRAAGKNHPAAWVAASPDCDLALLTVSGELDFAPLADREPPRGAAVRVFGYGGPPKAGTVVGADGSRFVGIGESWALALSPQPGDSGSPVIDAKGKVAGMVWGHAPDGRARAVRLTEIRRFLDDPEGKSRKATSPPIVSSPPAQGPAVPGFAGAEARYTPAGQFYTRGPDGRLYPYCPPGKP